MFGLTKLWSAIATLASNVTALAATVGEANTALRARLQMDGHEDEPLQLPHAPAEPEVASNGRRKHVAAK